MTLLKQVAFMVAFAAGGFGILDLTSALKVSVKNAGTAPVGDAIIHVSDDSCQLGVIKPSATATGTVFPKCGSVLELEYTLKGEGRKRVQLTPRLGCLTRGSVVIVIREAGPRLLSDESWILPWPG